ncbi:MAG TPA: TonB-dependent receptor plug domain-containing protein [Bacteroidales bacterium]|nr:TonB-dependent receptor plug domain-containing protein [Bacteroidales bacterium]
MRDYLTVSALLINSLIFTAFSQGTVAGFVTDNGTGDPVQGVYVITHQNKGSATGEDGFYSLNCEPGMNEIKFQFIGYKSIKRSVNITSADTLWLDIGLDMDIKEIGQIVVSADRTERKVAELTVSMDILKTTDFLDKHITDAQELITKTTGIDVLDGQVSVRGGSGFSYGVGSRVLALIDGLPVVSPDAGNIKWQFLPLENIQQIEIIKGASSVLYGSSALNGIINFRTASAGSHPETKIYAETGIFNKPKNRNWVWWDSPRIYSSASFSHLRKAGKNDIGIGLNLLVDNSYRKFNDERLARLSFRLKHRNAKVKGLAYGLNINSGYTRKTDFILWENAEYGALKQDTSSISELNGTFLAIDPYLSFNNAGRFRHDVRVRFQSSNNRFPVQINNNSDAYSFYAEYQGSFLLSEIFSITAGTAETYSNVRSNFYGDHEGMNIAGFSQIEANPTQKLKLVAGIRLEQNYLDKKNDRIVPVFRTGINWQAAEYTFLRTSFGQGYRYPSIAEKHASTTLGSVKIFPNPYVNAESGWSSEIGIKQGIKIGSMTGQADLSAFISQNKDMIEYVFSNYPDPMTGVFDFGFQANNVEQSRVYGFETEFSISKSTGNINTTLNGGYTYIYPVEFNPVTNKISDIYLKYRRKHSLKISSITAYKKFGFDFNLYVKSKILNIDDVFLNVSTRERILPGFYDYWQDHNTGYLLIDEIISYKINKVITISMALKNALNAEYMGRPGDIQPQRNYSLRLSGAF